MDPKELIGQLTKQLEEANHEYYVLDAPTMPDFEYDRLLRQLRGAGGAVSGAGLTALSDAAGRRRGRQPL